MGSCGACELLLAVWMWAQGGLSLRGDSGTWTVSEWGTGLAFHLPVHACSFS